MIKIGITGSLASGKTTASKILSRRRGPLFSADVAVKELYENKGFKSLILRKFKIKKNNHIKKVLRNLVIQNKVNLKKLERIIHPLVRKEMVNFTQKHKNKKFIFFEIPLLIESRLMKNFDIIFYIKAKKSLRLKRFKKKGGNKIFFNVLNKKQFSDKKKAKYCDHVIVNEKNLNIFKKNLLGILKRYE